MSGQRKLYSLQGIRAILFLTIFLFHTSAIGNINQTSLYLHCFSGGGTQAVAYFFVLSGFVEGLHIRKLGSKKEILSSLREKIGRFYKIHWVFLIVVIPIEILQIIRDPMKMSALFFINALLLQSWVPNDSVWLSYNGVSWFLSDMIFLTAFSVVLHRFCVWLEKREDCKKWFGLFLVGLAIVYFCVAGAFSHFGTDEINRYWLYAFPPMRILDYASGFFLARIFLRRRWHPSAAMATSFEIVAIGIFAGYLILFPYVPYAFGRSAIYLPGAVITIYIFALSVGEISSLLSRKEFVYFGNQSFYFMMSHQVFLRYCAFGDKYANRLLGIDCDWLWVLLAMLLTILSRPVYDRIFNRNTHTKKHDNMGVVS